MSEDGGEFFVCHVGSAGTELVVGFCGGRVDVVFFRQGGQEVGESVDLGLGDGGFFEIPHERDPDGRDVIVGNVHSYGSFAAGASFVDISEVVNEEVVANISEVSIYCVVFVDSL